MIFDRISNIAVYAKGDEKLAVIAEFLKVNPAETLADGRHELSLGIFANVGGGPVRDEGDFEVHRRYADLQLVVEGSEIMEWAHLDAMTNGTQYNEEGDFQLFSCQPAEASALKVYPGCFAIFYPQDGHKPSMRLDHDASRKVIFKIPV